MMVNVTCFATVVLPITNLDGLYRLQLLEI